MGTVFPVTVCNFVTFAAVADRAGALETRTALFVGAGVAVKDDEPAGGGVVDKFNEPAPAGAVPAVPAAGAAGILVEEFYRNRIGDDPACARNR